MTKTKAKVTLSVRGDLIKNAKNQKLNISKTVETALKAEIVYREKHKNEHN